MFSLVPKVHLRLSQHKPTILILAGSKKSRRTDGAPPCSLFSQSLLILLEIKNKLGIKIPAPLSIRMWREILRNSNSLRSLRTWKSTKNQRFSSVLASRRKSKSLVYAETVLCDVMLCWCWSCFVRYLASWGITFRWLWGCSAHNFEKHKMTIQTWGERGLIHEHLWKLHPNQPNHGHFRRNRQQLNSIPCIEQQ